MLPEVGHFCLIISLCLAAIQALMFSLSSNYYLRKISFIRPLALGQIFFVAISFIILSMAFVLDDFSVQYVANNSNSSLPLYYKLTALWGAHEGSLLLWVMILNAWLLAVLLSSNKWPINFSNKVISVISLINLGFLVLLLKTSNPFLRIMLNPPLDGADLNPLLQDIGMISHPPILYAGYVGSVVAFAFAIAALLNGKLDQSWARLVRPWVLGAWVFLTLGITLGSWWAYYELGWGGWWFWDPVENASFMPWLTATALLHCLAVAEKNGRFLRLALFLAITTFALSLLGTFIVRSGVLTSVHAFVTDPQRGVFILQFLTITIGGALFLYGARAPILDLPVMQKLRLFSQDSAILGNNILLLVAAGSVLLGTLYPLIYDVIFAQKISVGYPYFNAVFIPIIIVMLLLMLPTITPNRKYLLVTTVMSLVAAIMFLSLWFTTAKINAILGLTFALAIIINTAIAWQRAKTNSKLPMSIAHIGLAITIIGVSITPTYEIERDLRMQVGEVLEISAYAIKFNGIKVIDGPNYLGQQGDFTISKGSKKIAKLFPEKRLYLAQELPMTETAILPGVLQDIYIALGQQLTPDTWSMRVYYKPFVRWIWVGAIFMALGAILQITLGKRY